MARKFSSVDTAEAAYEQSKRDLEKGIANKVEAIFLLNQIINDLPGTWIADLAKALRDELES